MGFSRKIGGKQGLLSIPIWARTTGILAKQCEMVFPFRAENHVPFPLNPTIAKGLAGSGKRGNWLWRNLENTRVPEGRGKPWKFHR